MAHPVYTVAFCTAGRNAISGLIEASEHNRCTKEEVADKMNEALGLDPKTQIEAVDADTVAAAVRSGAFDSASQAFWDFRGRYGGIREAEAAPTKGSKSKSAE